MEQNTAKDRLEAALRARHGQESASSPSEGIVLDPSDPMRTIQSIIDTRDAVKGQARLQQRLAIARDKQLAEKQKFSVKKLVPRAKRDTLLQGAELVRGAALLAEPDPYAGTKEIVRSAADAPEAIGSVVAPSSVRRGSGMQTNAGGMLNLGERRNALTGEVTKTDEPEPLFPDAGRAEAGHQIRIQLASEWASKLEKMASEIDYVPSTSFGGQLLEGAAGSLPHFVGGIAVGGSATLAGGPIAGAAASAAYFSSTEGLMYLSDTYDDLRDQGFDHDEARSRAIMATGPYVAASAVLEFYGGKMILRGLGAGKHLDRVSKLPRWQQAIGGIGLAGVGEGSTEVMQGIVGDAISSYAQEDWSDFSERFNSDVNAQEFIVGAILGGGARTIGEIPNPENYKSFGAWKKAMGEDGSPVATMGDIPIIGPDGVARSFDSIASDQDKQAASEAIATGKAQDPQSIGQNPMSDQEFVQANLSQFFKENQTEGKIAEPKTDRQRQIQSQATDRGLNVLYVESNDGEQLGLPAAYVGRGTILLDANASDGQVADSLRWHESVHAVEDRSPEAFVNVYALLAETMPEETEAAVAEYRARWRAQHGTDISQERLAREAPSVAAEMILSTLIGAEESSPGTLSRMLAEKPGVIDQIVSLVQSLLRRVGLHQRATRIERVRQRKNHALAAAAIMDAVYALDGVRAGAYSTLSTQSPSTPVNDGVGDGDGDTSGVLGVENAESDSDSTPSTPRQVPVDDGPRRARVRVKDTTEFSEAEFRRTRERLAADFGFDSRSMEADTVLEGRDANSLEGSVDFTFTGDVPAELREALQGEGMRTRMMFSGNNPRGMGEDWMSDLGVDEMIRRARVLANETDPERERFLINEVGEDRVPGIGMMQTVRALREKNAAKYTLLHPDGSVFREYKTHNGALRAIQFQREAWQKKLLDRRNQGDTTITKADFEREGTIVEEGKGYGEDVALDNPSLLPVGATFEIAGETFIVYEDEGLMRAVSEDGEYDFLLEGVESMPITRRSLDQNAGRMVEFDEPVAADGMIGDIPFAVRRKDAPPIRSSTNTDLLKEHREFMRTGVSAIKEPERAARWDAIQTELRDRVYEHYKGIMPGLIAEADASGFPYLGVLMRVMERNIDSEHASGRRGGISRATRFTDDQLADIGEELAELKRGGGLGASVPAWMEVKDRGRDGVVISTPVGTIWAMRSQEKGAGDQVSSVMVNPFAINGQLRPGQPVWQALIDQDEQKPVEDDDYGVFGQRTFRANTGSQGGLFADQGDGESKVARENRERQEADEKRIGDEPDQGMLFALAGPKSRVWVPRIHAGEVPIDFDLDGKRIEGVELDSSAMRINSRTADRISAALGVINDRKSSREVITEKLGDVIEWPELFQAYPQIERMPVKIEITDAVDNFGGGLGITGFNTDLAEPVDMTVYLSPFAEIYKQQAGGDPFARADQHMKQTLVHEIQHAIAAYEGWQGGSNTSMIPLAAAAKRARDQLGVQYPGQEETIRARFGMYFENAGERMSRNAERRRTLTPEQRRAMPYDTTIESSGDAFWVGFAVPTKRGEPPNVTITSPAGTDIQLRDPSERVVPQAQAEREGGAQGQQRLSGSDPLTGEQGMLFAAALSTTSPRGFEQEIQALRDQKASTLRMVKEFTNARRAFISRSWTGADGLPHHMAELVSRETGPQREPYPWRVTSFMKRGDEAWEPWGHTIHRSRREAMIEAASGVEPEQVQEIRFATRRPDSKQPILPGTQPAQERFIPYGRPDLANPGDTEGVRGMVDAADELRNQIGLPNTRHDAQVEAEADAMMRMNRKIGDQLVDRANAGEILNDVETVVLQRHVNRLGLEALRENSSAGYVQGLRAIDAYRNSGTAAARAFRMRRDDLKSPSERFRESLMGALFEYDPNVRKKFKELRETITDPSTPPKKKKQAIDEQNRLFETEAKKIGRVRDDLAKAGLNPRGLNPISMSDPTTAAAVMDTARRARTGKADALYWIWMNNILSGPLTHMANMIGNSLNLVWRFGVVKPIEGAAGTVEGVLGGDPDFTLSDWMVMWKSIMPSLMAGYRNMAVSWSSNRQVFDEAILGEALPANTIKGEQVFVPDAGPRNKAVRALGLGGYPLKLLMVEDQFFKSFASTLEAYALAHRQAVREGLKGVERASRVQELLSPTQLLYGQYSFASEIWTQALDEGRKAVFQDDPSVLGKAALELRNGSLGPVFKWLIPFVRTPDRIFVRGIHMSGIGSLVGSLNAAAKGYESARGKELPFGFSKAVSRRESAAGDIAVAITSLAMLMLLYGLKDDEEGRPRITGSASRDYRDRAEQYRTAPPQSIRIGGKWYSYARLEPFATGMAMTIDMLNEVEGSGDLSSALPAGGRSLVRQTQDKTFLEGVGSLIEAVEQIAKDDPDEDRGVDMVAGIARRTLITGWVPNLFKQVARADNPTITESRPNKDDPFWDRQLAGLEYDLLPLERFADTPRYDVWGRPIERGAPVDGRFVGFLWRVGVPINVSDDDLHPMDLLLDNYNERVKRGDFEGHPMGGEMHAYPPPRTFIRNGERVRMTSEEYQSFVRDAGRAASERLLSMDLNIEEPTPRDAAIIREVMGMFYDRERERMLRSRIETREQTED